MALDARIHIFVKPSGGLDMNPSSMKMTASVFYITDVAPDRVYCKQEELFRLLKSEYQFDRKILEDLEIKLNCGSPLVINLLEKNFFELPEEILINKEVVRGDAFSFSNLMDFYQKRHNKAEQLIKKNFFSP